MKRMSKENAAFQFPPVWCSRICRNSMSEKCITECSLARDCRSFEEKPGLTLSEMPKFPETADMTREEKFKVVVVYLSKVTDQLQGVPQNEYYITRRPHPNHPAGSEVSSAVPIQGVLSGLTKAIADPTAGQEYQSTPVRSSEVAESAD